MTVGLVKTLGAVFEKVCIEVGISTQAALNIDVKNAIKSFIADEALRLVDEFDWLKLRGDGNQRWFDVTLHAGQRYYDFPAGMDPQTITGVATLQGGAWQPLTYGITLDDYTAFNSDDDARADPAMKWDFKGEQFEVHPIPATDDGTVRFEARQSASEVIDDALPVPFDYICVAKFAAASYLRSRHDDAGEMRRRADKRYAEGMARLTTLKSRRGKFGASLNFARPRRDEIFDPRFRIRVVS